MIDIQPERTPAAVRRTFHTQSRRVPTVRSSLLFGCVSAAYLITFGLAVTDETAVLRLLFAVSNGVCIGLLFILGHDACHGTLMPSRAANRVLARLAFLPALQPPTSWVASHNGRHHRWTNLKGVDPGYAPLTKTEYDAMSPGRQRFERICRTPIGVVLLYLVTIYWRYEIFPADTGEFASPRAFEHERVTILIFVLAQLVTGTAVPVLIHGSALLPAVLTGVTVVVVPFAVWSWIGGFLTFQHHTHPQIPWFDDRSEWSFFAGQVQGTAHIRFPGPMNLFLENIMEHTAHHVDTRIPLWNLRRSQERLEDRYRGIVTTERWTPRTAYRTFRSCKLYDYKSHTWLDFRGRPTSVSTLRVQDSSARSAR